MKKNLLTPLILLAVLLGLAGIAYWDETKTATDKTVEEAKGKLFAFNPAEIISIEITNVTTEPKSWTLVKDQEKKIWSVQSPLVYSADGEGVDRLLKILVDAKAEREFDKGSRPLDSFGLEPAQIIYKLKDQAGKTYTFSLGGKSPTGFSSYALKDQEPKVLLVNQYLFTATNKTLVDFRDRKLGVPNIADIKAVNLSFAGQAPIRLERIEKDWKVVAPIQAEADTLDTNKWLSSWDNLRVLDFIDSPSPELRKALTGLSKGTKEVVKVQFSGEGIQKEFVLVENNGKVYSQLSEQTFVELDRPSVESLRKSPQEFEDRSIFKFVSAEVSQVVIDGNTYVKKKDDWVAEKSGQAMPFVQSLLVSLEFAKADLKLTAKEAEASLKGPALHTVEIVEAQKPKLQFSIWKKLDGEDAAGMFVLKSGEAYFLVNSEFVELFKPKSPESKRASK